MSIVFSFIDAMCFLQAIIHMVEANLDGNPYWYPLRTHDENGEPLAPPTPNQSPQSSFRSKGQRGPGEVGMYPLCLLFFTTLNLTIEE